MQGNGRSYGRLDARAVERPVLEDTRHRLGARFMWSEPNGRRLLPPMRRHGVPKSWVRAIESGVCDHRGNARPNSDIAVGAPESLHPIGAAGRKTAEAQSEGRTTVGAHPTL